MSTSLSTASANEQSDVHLVSLLSSLTRTIGDAKEFGTKYSVVQKARMDHKKVNLARGQSGGYGNSGGFTGGNGGGLMDNGGEEFSPGF